MAESIQRNEEAASSYDFEDSYCTDALQIVKFKYTWSIPNFSLRSENVGKALKSSIFPSQNDDSLKWTLVLYPKGETNEHKDYISLFLYIATPNYKQETVQTECKVAVLDGQYNEIQVGKFNHIFLKNKDNRYSGGFGYSKLISRDFLLNEEKNALPDDTLIVRCEISAVVSGTENIANNLKLSKLALPHDLLDLFQNPEFSDVTISVDKREFQVHKGILAARSSVFKAMFHADMEENRNQRVEITDFDEVVVEELLRFIYTGTVRNLKDTADGLIKAADKYALTRLKAMCEVELINNLTVTNAAYILTLADLHSADELKARTKKYILNHMADVAKTMEWMTMVREYPRLLQEVLMNQ